MPVTLYSCGFNTRFISWNSTLLNIPIIIDRTLNNNVLNIFRCMKRWLPGYRNVTSRIYFNLRRIISII